MIKNAFFFVIRISWVNKFLRTLIKLFAPILPFNHISNFPVVGEIRLDLPNFKTIKFISDGRDSMSSRIYWHGVNGFEPETINLFLHLLKYSHTVLDIGAHVGLYALIAGTDDLDRDVHAFEPVPHIYQYMVRNINNNGANNVTSVKAAVTNFDGEVTLYVPRAIRLTPSASIQQTFREECEAINVRAVKIDTYKLNKNIGKVGLMKIDAEGAEADVLCGSAKILQEDKPAIICEVLKGYNDEKIVSVFEAINYKFFLITSDGLLPQEQIIGDETYFYKNYLFIPEDKIPVLLNGIKILNKAEV